MGKVLLCHWSSFSSQKLASGETWHGVKKKNKTKLNSELGSNLDLALAMGMNLSK